LPRLINTICENALITAYAKHLTSVTPEIIEDVSTDFRLDTMEPPADCADVTNNFDRERAARLLLDLCGICQIPVTSLPGVGIKASEMGKDEQHI
jgi:hypothetical protein